MTEGFDGLKAHRDYEEAVIAKIEEIKAKEGSQYTKEEKWSQIRDEMEKMTDQYLKQVKAETDRYNERVRDLSKKIDDKLTSMYPKALENIDEIKKLRAEIESNLKKKGSTKAVEHEFQQIVERSKEDRIVARFLSKNYYLFIKRAQELATTDLEAQRSTSNIRKASMKVQSQAYDCKEKTLKIMLGRLKYKEHFTNHATKSIQASAKRYLKRSKSRR